MSKALGVICLSVALLWCLLVIPAAVAVLATDILEVVLSPIIAPPMNESLLVVLKVLIGGAAILAVPLFGKPLFKSSIRMIQGAAT